MTGHYLHKLLTGFFVLLSCAGLAQSPADWWYFGFGAGIHFTPSGPVAVFDGQLSTNEGCATISDNDGNLLFYTDGQTVYDATHTIMPNGTGLFGHNSSSHSAVVVPRPGNPNEYYIFTIDAFGTSGVGMHYSKVDMSLNGGLGDVVSAEKNIFLTDSVTEKISSVQKSDGYWAITHRMDFDEINAFEITAAGVNLVPVVSNTGHPVGTGFGYCMKPSPDGDKIAAVHTTLDSICVYNFNKNTGQVTGTTLIGNTMGAGFAYGVEFSPDGTRLYAQTYHDCDVRQYDMTLGSSAAISASETLLGVIGSPEGGGALQLGPDGKIYVAKQGSSYLAVIHDPNTLGTLANFEDSAIFLGGGSCIWGLPTFIQSFFAVSFEVSGFCFPDPTLFSTTSMGVDSVLWNFGDPASGAQNTSGDFSPSHLFSDTGVYTVTLLAFHDTLTDTITEEIHIYPHQTLDLGPDLILCNVDSVVFDVSQPYSDFLWQDGSTGDSMIVTGDSLISVTVFGVCDTLADSVIVVLDFPFSFDLGPDTLLCGVTEYELDANLQTDASVLWNTTDTVDSMVVTLSGTYIMNATNACNEQSDTVEVTLRPVLGDSMLPPDTLQCFDNTITLRRPQVDDVTFVWSDSTSKASYNVDTTETVWLAAFNECGFWIDTIHITFNGEIKTELGNDTVICEDDSLTLFATWPGVSYQWNTGDTTDSIRTLDEDMNYIVTITKGDCRKVESKRVELNELACPDIDCTLQYPNVITPNADGFNDRFRASSDCNIYFFDLSIYNRWGQLVHYTNNVSFGWDGFIHGEPAPAGVYYFRIEYRDEVVVDSDRNQNQGSITLIR